MQREEPRVRPEHRKDPQDEAFLERLNAILAPYQDEDYRDLPEAHPTLHIIGAPRSGTTLLYQLLASHLDVGYVNNLVAAFWRAPVYGIRLSKKLVPRGAPSSFRSEFGRTAGIAEPHEFGYFWSSLLGYAEPQEQPPEWEATVDWARVARVLTNMTHAAGGPMLFKTFHLGWHVRAIQAVLPRTCFVRIRRDPLQNALSIAGMRERFLGDLERWASFRPREFDRLRDEPWWVQVAGQVHYLERSMTAQIQAVQGRNVLEVSYGELCGDPGGVLERVRDLLARNGAPVDRLADPPASFPEQRADPSHPHYARVAEAMRRFQER